MSGLYASDGSFNGTIVDGLTYTGVYAADGSINMVDATGLVYVGAYHPCGAWWITQVPSNPPFEVPVRAPDGSLYINITPYPNVGGQKVTIVGGSLPTGYVPTYYLMISN